MHGESFCIAHMCTFTERMCVLITMRVYRTRLCQSERERGESDGLGRVVWGWVEEPNLKHDKSSGALDTGGAAATATAVVVVDGAKRGSGDSYFIPVRCGEGARESLKT